MLDKRERHLDASVSLSHRRPRPNDYTHTIEDSVEEGIVVDDAVVEVATE